jgi:hypothetical protein
MIFFVISMLLFSNVFTTCKYLFNLDKENEPVTFYKHVGDFIANIPPRNDQKLWAGFNNPNYSNVPFKGVHNDGKWSPPAGNATPDGGFNKIASPAPKSPQSQGSRVIASELPGKTYSASSFDLPDRKNVIQINLPNSTTKTSQLSYNAYTTQTSKFNNLKATLHGISSDLDKPVYHGRFIQTENSDKNHNEEMKKSDEKDINKIVKDVKVASNDALTQAKKVENKAKNLAASVTPDPTNLAIPVLMKNKKESLFLKLKDNK